MRLGDCCKTNLHTYSEKEKWSLIRYLDTGNITEGRIDEIQTLYPGVDKIPSRARRKVSVGDILFSTVRPNQKHFGIIEAVTENLLVSTGFAVVTVDTNVADPYFIYYYLTQSSVIESLQAIAEQSTSTYPSIKPSDIEDIELDLPELETQKKIGSTLRMLDGKRSLNDKINDNLQQQLRSIFKAELTDNPDLESMTQIPLSDLCLVVTKGTTPTTLGKPFVESGINFIKAESILADHSIDKSKFAFIDEETNALLKRSIIHAGDVVFTIAGTLGRFALIDENVLPANTNQAVAIIRADVEKVLPEYIYSCFIGEWHTDYYAKRVQQAVQANLSLTTIKSLPIPLLDDVKMGEYLKLILPIIKSIKVNEAQNKKLAALRDNLLPKLMSGAIDVSDIQF